MASVPFHTREGLHAMRITTAISRSLPHGGTEGDGRRDSRSHNILGAERTASTSAFFNTLRSYSGLREVGQPGSRSLDEGFVTICPKSRPKINVPPLACIHEF